MISELDFYLSLYDNFLKTIGIDKKKILWKSNSIVKLMELVDKTNNNQFCENGLRLIMTLFKDYQFDSCDIESSDFNLCSNLERESIMPILIKEFK
ncbi:MAG: hypothetical protein ACFFFB_03265 [Candidatus Heimdallarchaeota archaeon]